MSALNEVADRIDARTAQLVVAKIMATLGSAEDWGGDEIMAIDELLQPVAAASGLPAFNDTNADDAYNFWLAVSNTF
ncbi:hypothetical protein [Mycobacteroides abscessus]|uniref:hypothetical protein n=1 Tax=Mycobacteroides abscessus TaxID=36809 RepID=UPI000C264C7F|nr:hypothetical protein [Mycobacteroides abscessus]